MNLLSSSEALEQHLRALGMHNTEAIEALLSLSKPNQLKKNEHFIRQGERTSEFAFVQTGILRSYYLNSNAEEMTYCVLFPPILITAYASFLTGEPTKENIQALTKVEMLSINKADFMAQIERFPEWNIFLKTIAEQQYLELEKRFFQMQGANAQQRYHELQQNHPEYIRQIPLHVLASWLGISQRHLSRIRAAMLHN